MPVSRFGHFPKTRADLHTQYLVWKKENCGQRFGQWLYNKFVHDNQPWGELFYETDEHVAYNIALTHISQGE